MNNNVSLVETQFNQVIDLIKKFEDKSNDSSNNPDDLSIISVIGDRGFGKTTILSEIEEKHKSALFLDIIEPLIVTNEEKNDFGILELIFASLYKYVSKSDKITQSEKAEFNGMIEKELSYIFNKGISELDKLESSIAILYVINKQREAKENIQKIINKILILEKKENLIIRIDDIDLLSKKNLQNSLNDLHKFLTVKNVIIIAAYNEVKLKDEFLEIKLKDNLEIVKGKLSNELDIAQQVENELNKIFPTDTKVYLPLISQIYNKQAHLLFADVMDSDITIKQYLLNIHDEICPVNSIPYLSYESNEVLLPNSIRKILQYKSLMNNMSQVNKTIDFDEYKLWFISNVLTKIQNPNYRRIIKEFDESENKPVYIVKQLRKEAKNISDNNNINIEEHNVMIDYSRDYNNIALGDIQQILNTFYDFDNSQDAMNLIYVIKILLSIELRKNLLMYKETKVEEYIENYFKIAKGYPTPINRNYFDVQWIPLYNKYNIEDVNIIDYEKLMLLLNTVTPYNVGEKIWQNSSFIFKALNTQLSSPITMSKVRVENQVNLYENYEKPDISVLVNNGFTAYFERLTSTNVGLAANYNVLANPYVFFFNESYINWALKKNQLVLWDMFSLDYLYDLKTHLSSESNPWKRIYKRIDTEVNSKLGLYSIEKNMIENSEIQVWWDSLANELDIKQSSDQKSILRQNIEIIKEYVALYTRYENRLNIERIIEMNNEEISHYYELIKDWKKPPKQPSAGKNPKTLKNIADDFGVWESEVFRKEFAKKFTYEISNYEKEERFYTGTEIGQMRSFIREFGRNERNIDTNAKA